MSSIPVEAEKELKDTIRGWGVTIVEGEDIQEVSKPYVCSSFLLPDYNLALQYNKIYECSSANGHDMWFQNTQYRLYKKTNISLYFVWEDDFSVNKGKCLNILRSLIFKEEPEILDYRLDSISPIAAKGFRLPPTYTHLLGASTDNGQLIGVCAFNENNILVGFDYTQRPHNFINRCMSCVGCRLLREDIAELHYPISLEVFKIKSVEKPSFLYEYSDQRVFHPVKGENRVYNAGAIIYELKD